MHPLLRTSEEVGDALAENRPVVALESTVIAHGLPYPGNVETALAIEKAVRESGAVPATVGLDGGRFTVGMSPDDMERFAVGPDVPKVSSRDVGVVLAGGGLGATTVASSLVAADLAGIPFFSTAGIGGVHRGAGESFDISADLVQFTRSKVAVVCAGAKSILDLGLTLEYLETLGVPVIGYRFDHFPAFYCRSSGLRVPQRIDDPGDIARAVRMHWAAGLPGGALITAPIDEEHALDSDLMEGVIQEALRAAEDDGVRGPAATPYLMKAVSRATEGRSAAANREVLISTARLAGHLAVAYAATAEPAGKAAAV
ncbi:pseudouridine-5'-phosphate glycosidase [Streptomyces tauricus]|uniref:Pseudouridine-5'-phosphate glycosidase n=1 Tax=Streptomyces tauricus TaxID=68274 RepID=A0ABZ1JRI9_9ACTN|nr:MULTISPECIES: pseudouridine-5'-phosphate glycosidase [Streptomyces]MCW8096762.1 pseudouridine-5'-phosphate glycosidase [Streptomyces tauricus]UPZ32920.1 pseudouridine-5'-phosphate glycosidase [Streptomyces sp. LRE541]GHA34989.1 pseudouridine-5'-phosphate glycosidase [Streptomyces tauricus]